MAPKKNINVEPDLSSNSDPASETAIISALFRYGSAGYIEASTFVNTDTFSLELNSLLWKCCDYIFQKDINATLDIPSIYSAANSLGIASFLESPTSKAHIRAAVNFPTSQESIPYLAAKIKRLHIARLLRKELLQAETRIGKEITGDEALANIFSIAEQSILDFSNNICNKDDNGPTLAFQDAENYVEFLANNPCDQVGISTGYPIFDSCLGGGLRFGSVSAIAARLKTGKSAMAINIGFNIAGNGIPILYLDTEMSRAEHSDRMLARVSGVPIREIETGQFAKHPDKNKKVREAAIFLKDLPFHYQNICNWDFADILSVARRWIVQKVGLKTDGKANPCVVILDYLKMMNNQALSKNIAEFQELGFQMGSLVGLVNKYKVASLCFLQSNRDGLTREDTGVAAASDRISWFASNLSLLKRQSREEMAEQNLPNPFNRKLVPLVTRHGPDFTEGDFIHLDFQGHLCRMTEGPLNSEFAESQRVVGSEGQIDTNDNDVDDENTVF